MLGYKFSGHLSEWKDLALILGFDMYDIERIDKDSDEFRLKPGIMLSTWLRRNGSAATYEVLYKALSRLGRRDLAENFLKTAG